MKLKSILLTGVFSAMLLSACNSGGSTSTPGNNDIGGDGILFQQKAAYVDLTATNLNKIPDVAYSHYNMMIYAFANPNTSSIDQKFLTSMQKIINLEAPGTVNLLSLGGQYATTNTFNKNTANTILTNILAQIDSYNAKLTNGKINGVDLDLENGIDSDTIYTLAAGFKARGLKVSIAPQAFVSSGTNVRPNSPTNLVLTSGWGTAGDTLHQNVYGKTIVNHMTDYIIIQPYNTPDWTISGWRAHGNPAINAPVGENTSLFLTHLSEALAQLTLPTCNTSAAATDPLCIPAGIPIIIAQPANFGAASFSAFNPGNKAITPPRQDSQALETVSTEYTAVENYGYGIRRALMYAAQGVTLGAEEIPTPTGQTYITGVAVWSLNNDYDPEAYGAKNIEANGYTKPGMFSCSFFHVPTTIYLPNGQKLIFDAQGRTTTTCPGGYPQ